VVDGDVPENSVGATTQILDRVNLREVIENGCDRLGIRVPSAAPEAMVRYLELVTRWNRVFNLTAVRTPADMVPRHLLDSLSIVPHIAGPRVLDVGSGAGLPGIPLALARPELDFVLLDASAKRTRFLTQVRAELDLSQVAVERVRVEHYRPEIRFDTVVSRAFADCAELLRVADSLCATGGRVVAMRGREASAAAGPGWSLDTYRLQVPGLDAQRHVHVFRRTPNR
jgi:16S rRNA (guanine527-N7)-methyltransferase